MEIWDFLAIMTVCGAVEEIVRHWLRYRERTAKAAADGNDLSGQIGRIERRLANLETIVLEREKKSEFEHALK